MLAYRIEDKTYGEGPYTGPFAIDEMAWAHEGPDHPAPFEDKRLWHAMGQAPDGELHFGFGHIETLKAWFHGWRARLSRSSFVLAVYEVDREFVIAGDHQLMFVKERSTLVDQLDPATLRRV